MMNKDYYRDVGRRVAGIHSFVDGDQDVLLMIMVSDENIDNLEKLLDMLPDKSIDEIYGAALKFYLDALNAVDEGMDK